MVSLYPLHLDPLLVFPCHTRAYSMVVEQAEIEWNALELIGGTLLFSLFYLLIYAIAWVFGYRGNIVHS